MRMVCFFVLLVFSYLSCHISNSFSAWMCLVSCAKSKTIWVCMLGWVGNGRDTTARWHSVQWRNLFWQLWGSGSLRQIIWRRSNIKPGPRQIIIEIPETSQARQLGINVPCACCMGDEKYGMQQAAQPVNAQKWVDANGVIYSAMNKFIGQGGSRRVHQVTSIENAYISLNLCGTSPMMWVYKLGN